MRSMPVGIVTGASRGLGLALARALNERGWRLVVDARGGAPPAARGERAGPARAHRGLAAERPLPGARARPGAAVIADAGELAATPEAEDCPAELLVASRSTG